MKENPLRDLPMGFGMALAQNTAALAYFSSLPQAEQKKILEHTHEIRSKQEMQSYVNHLPGEIK